MKLLEEGYIGSLRIRNRIKFASTTTCYCTEEGRVTEQEKKWLEERAKGGAGLVTTGIAHVTPWGRLNSRMLGGWDDSFISDFRQLVDAIHSGDAKACLSLGHCGRYACRKEELTDASSVPTRIMTRAAPHELDEAEIVALVRAFAQAARRAKEAGFDAVEVCACAGYLLSSFLSPWTNRRTDRYGGSIENRARFSLEVVEAIKAEDGQRFPLVFRMCADELMPGGNSPDDLRKVASMLQGAGVDALSLTVGWHESTVPAITGEIPRGHWLYLAEKMKKAVRIPVMMAYRVAHAEAEKAAQEGGIDFWEASRPFIADPQMPRKLAENRPEDIVPCICCCQGCYDSVFQGRPIWCVVNPRAGRESDPEYAIARSENPRKVIVIGGGPAGMEAGIIASMRGHQVTLLEKESTLGGNLLTSSIPPFKQEFGDLMTFFMNQLRKHKVSVQLGCEVTADSLNVKETDVIVLAAGASPLVTNLPGVLPENVMTALDVLLGRREVAQSAVVVGGGMVGCETAEFLRKKGKEVIVLEMLDKVAGDMGPTLRWRLLARLREAGVKIETGVRVAEIREGGVEVVRNGQSEFFQAGDIVLALGMKPNKLDEQALKSKGAEFYQVGDCLRPRKLGEAILDAFSAAAKI